MANLATRIGSWLGKDRFALSAPGPVLVPGPIANRPQAASLPHTPGEPSLVEMGTTGTGIFGQGYIRELGEYNPDFSGGPFTAYRTYEQMRRGSASVAATTLAMKLPVRCAEWKIQPPKDATPVEKECAEFVETCLFDDIDFDRMLENLLLALDFGSAAHEDIWTVTNGKVVLAKAAARMPLTFYTWTVDQNEDLVELVQHGFHGGSFTEFRLPADKIALYTFRQEGANFAGRAILREMYQHWYTLMALYKIDAIAAERNGMGVPVGTLGQEAKKEDRETYEKFLSSVAAHQSAYLMQPFGYKFELVGVTGQVRDCKESIQHHTMQISLAALAQFMLMGQQSRGSGNRSLGETMSDFFFLSLQTLANQVGDCISDSTIARLAAYNYGPGVRAPRLIPQRIIAMKFESITQALSQLGTAGIVTPDPDLELWLRQLMGAPDVDRAELVKMRQAAVTSGAPDKEAGGGAGAGNEGDAEDGAADDGAAERAAPGGAARGKVAATSLRGEVREPGAGRGKTGPDLTASEGTMKREAGTVGSESARRAEKCLALTEIVSALDKGRDDVAAALRAARPRVQAEIINRLLSVPVRKMHRASVAADEKLTGQVKGILQGIAAFGQKQIGEERARQLAGGKPGDAQKIRMADAGLEPVGLYADAVVSEWQNMVQSRATNAMVQRRVRQDSTVGELITDVGEDLDGQSDKWVDGVASKGANEAFAAGRDAGFAEYAEEIDHYIYSALLDVNTCEACAAADGTEGAEDEVPGVPNADCDGGDRCRCVLVAVFKDEGKSA